MNTCSTCGNSLGKYQEKYCSRTCFAQRGAPTVACAHCGAETRNTKFCGQRCAAVVTNSTHPRRVKITRTCEHCGNETSNRRYCSGACHHAKTHKDYVDAWLAGLVSGSGTDGEATSFVRRWVHERDGHKCSQCGWAEINPKSGKSPIAMDHIDGDHRNNRPENLRILCPNCHSLTPTYGNLNKGFGRPSRRKISGT